MAITIENPGSTGSMTVRGSTGEGLNGLRASSIFFDEIDELSRLSEIRTDTDRVFQNALNNLSNINVSSIGEVAAVTGTENTTLGRNQRVYSPETWTTHTTTSNRTFPDQNTTSNWLDNTLDGTTRDMVMRSAPIEDDINDLQDDIKYLDRDIIQVNKELQKSKDEVRELKEIVEYMQEQLKMLLEV